MQILAAARAAYVAGAYDTVAEILRRGNAKGWCPGCMKKDLYSNGRRWFLTTDDLSAVVNTVRFNDTTFRVCSECFTWTVHKNRGAFVDADNKPAIFFPRLDPRNRRVLRTRATAVLT